MNSEEFSCIKQVVKTVQVSLPFMFISNEFAGITGVLDSWKRQYVKQLQAIVVGYKNVSLTSPYGAVSTQRSYVICNVKATFDLFCPNIGDIVKGKINRVSREHIGCLIQGTINVTIHMPRNTPCGLSKYIYLDRDILFEITHFSCEPKVIRVTGDITSKCIELMNDLFTVDEEDASFAINSLSALGEENSSSDRETSRVNLSILNSVKTSEKVKEEVKTKKSKKRKRESESSVSLPFEESLKNETDEVEEGTPNKKLKSRLDADLTDSPKKLSKKKKSKSKLDSSLNDSIVQSPKKKKSKSNLGSSLNDSIVQSPKKKKSKSKLDCSHDDSVIDSPKKELESNQDTSISDSSAMIALNSTLVNAQNFNHVDVLKSIKKEVGSPRTPSKGKSSLDVNKKKRKRELSPPTEEKNTVKNKKNRKKKNKDGSKSKDKKNPLKKKAKIAASGTVLKKDKKKSHKAKNSPKKEDESKSSKSKKNRKKDKSEKRKTKKLKLSTDIDAKDVLTEIKSE